MTGEGERLARFARAHLRSPAQRAVYATLAGAPTRATTARAIAERFPVDARQVDVVLRQFEAAGIAEPAGRTADGQRRFRWRRTMAYLHTEDDPPALLDPVCGMPLPPDTAYQEGGHRFCSLRCHMAWRVAARSAG